MDHRIVRDLMMGVDGEAPACQPPTSAPSPHRATVDAVQCGDVGCAGAMCTAGWCKGSCCGVAGAHRSKVRLWAHARRGRRETLDVPALKKGAIGLGCRTFYPSFEAPCVSGTRHHTPVCVTPPALVVDLVDPAAACLAFTSSKSESSIRVTSHTSQSYTIPLPLNTIRYISTAHGDHAREASPGCSTAGRVAIVHLRTTHVL